MFSETVKNFSLHDARAHTTPFGSVRDYRLPYRQYAFLMCMLGLALFVMGIVGFAYQLKTQKV